MFRLLLSIAFAVSLLTACTENKQEKPVAVTTQPPAQSPSFRLVGTKVFERVSTVLDGYQAFSGKLPLKLQDLDSGGYMFDSTYLTEILPEGAELFLALAADKGATGMWLQQSGQKQVLSRTLLDSQLKDLSVDDLNVLKSKWQVVAKVGRLTQVQL